MKPSIWRWLFTVAVAAGLVALLLPSWNLWVSAATPPSGAPSSVQIQIRPLVKTLDLVGTLRPRSTLELTAPFDGAVQARPFAWGEPLRQGAVLLRLSTDDIDREIREAESATQRAHFAAEPLRNWEASVEVQRAQRAVAHAQRGVSEGERKLLETGRLLELGVVPRMELDDLSAQQRQLVEQLASARDELTSVRSRGEAAQRRSAELELENARRKLESLKKDRTKNQLLMSLDGTVSPAPSGSSRASGSTAVLEIGSRVKRGEVLLRMQSADQFELLALADETDVTLLKKGQKAWLRFAALPEMRLHGTVAAVSTLPTTSESERPGEAVRYEARLLLEGASADQLAQLRLGLSGQASVEVYRRDDAIQLPFDAVRQDAGGAYVTLLDSQGRPSRQAVRTGLAGVNEVEVFGSLRAGVRVLLSSPGLPPSPSTAASFEASTAHSPVMGRP